MTTEGKIIIIQNLLRNNPPRFLIKNKKHTEQSQWEGEGVSIQMVARSFNSNKKQNKISASFCQPVAKFLVPDWGYEQPYTGANYIPQSGTTNLASHFSYYHPPRSFFTFTSLSPPTLFTPYTSLHPPKSPHPFYPLSPLLFLLPWRSERFVTN
jgi:hypothetical protein